MVCTESKASMVIAGRGARACDMCGKERAKWYCAADEAYLCEKCDASVHSANSVARRHERVKLGPNGAPVKLKPSHSHHRKSKGSYPHLPQPKRSPQLQKWWNSTKKRSRTPRRSSVLTGQSMCAVISSINPRPNVIKEEKDDALLLYDLLTADYQLGDISASPPFDVKVEPFSPSSTLTSREFPTTKVEETEFPHEVPTYEPLLHDVIVMEDEDLLEKISTSSPSLCNARCNSGGSTTLKPDLMSVQLCVDTDCSTAPKSEPGAFDAESGSLFVNSVVEGSTADIHGNISISDDSDIDTFDVMDLCSATNMDDMQVEELQGGLAELDMWKDAYTTDEGACNSVFEGNPFKGKWEKEPEVGCTINVNEQWSQKSVYQNPLSLRLDYEDVISAWSDRGSLWMDGHRPQIVPDLSLLDHGCSFMIFGETGCNSSICSQPGQVPSFVVTDRAREARVLRYKEKRRTRLFSKKIRYEVRKLNAERRPRMKGRFVKRSAIAAAVM